MAVSHQSPQSTLPPLALKTINTTTWGAGGNTCTITDPYVHTNSLAIVQVSGSSAQQAGFWSVAYNQGSMVITSSSSESSTLPIAYAIY